MRVSLPGYDCLTDTTIDHYGLYADSDNILIKELSRGAFNITSTNNGTVSHNLGYIPFYLGYCQVGASRFRIANSFDPVGSGWRSFTDTSKVVFQNRFGSDGTVQYFIFYDNLT